jgi:predicted metal-dependent hydrolase
MPRVAVRGIASLDLFVRPDASSAQREDALLRWYWEQLKALVPERLLKWQPLLGTEADQWGIKKMKTKWGSRNPNAMRLWFNLVLAKKPVLCLEYIVVHELLQLLDRRHSERFTALMDGFLPQYLESWVAGARGLELLTSIFASACGVALYF